MGKKLQQGELFRVAFQKLKDSGFIPDITIFHSGWGIGVFKSVLTISFAYGMVVQLGFIEAKFDPNSEYSPSSHLNERISQHYLNLTQAFEISESDYVWSPTNWQREQFPKSIQNRIEVIHEGVDTKLFKPSNKVFDLSQQINVTYTSRALEPMRCYNHFYKIISRIMQAFPLINLTIVGKTKPVYRPISGTKTSLFDESFRLFNELSLTKRIKYYPRLDMLEYIKLLSESHIHFYLSRPFIASWSLFEAMSSGCCLVSNSTPMTSEFLGNSRNALMIDSVDQEQSALQIIDHFSNESLINAMAANARKSILQYDCRNQLKLLKSFIGF